MRDIRILLVEDNQPDVGLLEEYLSLATEASYPLTHVDSLATCLKVLNSTDFDIVLLDLGLTDSHGLQTLMEVVHQVPTLPIVVLTGLDDIKTGIEAVKNGAQDYLNKNDLTLALLEKSIHHAIERKRMLVDLNILKQREHELAMHDSLTGLPNRLALTTNLENIILHAKRTLEKFAVFFIDLDHFKVINDSQGHDIGDCVLQEVAQRMRSTLRESDIVSRIGGDEFICIIRDVVNIADISVIARKIIARMQQPVNIKLQDYYIGCSIGIALYPRNGADTVELIKSADSAMYVAKEQGRNQFQMAHPKINKLAKKRFNVERDLQRALAHNELEVYYQPIVRTDINNILGCEALVRWDHPEEGFLLPDNFIPNIEHSGLIIQIGEYVLREAGFRWKTWRDLDIPQLRIAVNISPLHFKQPNFIHRLKVILDEVGSDGCWLDLEISEALILDLTPQILDHCEQLKAMGIGISIDDFGTGYASLSSLRNYPLSSVKIDKELIDNAVTSENDNKFIKGILALAKQLELKVIAAGVETLEQVKTLNSMECNRIQGFYYSKPLAPPDFEGFLLNFMRERAKKSA